MAPADLVATHRPAPIREAARILTPSAPLAERIKPTADHARARATPTAPRVAQAAALGGHVAPAAQAAAPIATEWKAKAAPATPVRAAAVWQVATTPTRNLAGRLITARPAIRRPLLVLVLAPFTLTLMFVVADRVSLTLLAQRPALADAATAVARQFIIAVAVVRKLPALMLLSILAARLAAVRSI